MNMPALPRLAAISALGLLLTGCADQAVVPDAPADTAMPIVTQAGSETVTPTEAAPAAATPDLETLRSRLAALEAQLEAMGGSPGRDDIQPLLDQMSGMLDQMQAMMDRRGMPSAREHRAQMQAMMAQMKGMMAQMQELMRAGGMMDMMGGGRSMQQMMQRMQQMHGRLAEPLPTGDRFYPTPTP